MFILLFLNVAAAANQWTDDAREARTGPPVESKEGQALDLLHAHLQH